MQTTIIVICNVAGIFVFTYMNNEKCMYTSACGDVVDCIEFI